MYSLGANTALSALNDGNGIFRNSVVGENRFDLVVTVGGTAAQINIGDISSASGTVTEAAPTTVGGLIDRLNAQLEAKFGGTDVRAAIGADGASITLTDAGGRMVEQLLTGRQVDVSDPGWVDNGAGRVPAFLQDSVLITADNVIEELVDSGFYTEQELRP